jgi:phosphatidylinositol alpha 1,6-mannosyltransferase
MSARPSIRVAYFTDSFDEVNGLARTSREMSAFTRRNGLPMLLVRPGETTRSWSDGNQMHVELHRAATSIPVDGELSFDPLLPRHLLRLRTALRRFRPDVIHVTGPGDIGLMGAYLSFYYGIPLVASWHNNLHELAARRLHLLLDHPVFSLLPRAYAEFITSLTERGALESVTLFYKLARRLFAPNPDLVRFLADHTGKPVHLMPRAVDTRLFHPNRRLRQDGAFTLGFAGRLQPEKNVRLLAQVQRALPPGNHRFLILGEGFERTWLKRRLRRAEFLEFLDGEQLASAYANMDLFLNPSLTDTYGTSVHEALASGVPAVVMNQGGPQHLISSGRNGFVCQSEAHFVRQVADVLANPLQLQRMRLEARESACLVSWDQVFDDVYQVYEAACGHLPTDLRVAS